MKQTKVVTASSPVVKQARQKYESTLKHPLLLVDAPVTLMFKETIERAPAWVTLGQDPRTGKLIYPYKIEVFNPVAKDLYSRHPFRSERYTYQDFVIGLLAHEVSHILFGALEIRHPYDNNIYSEISNILDDSHDEYGMQRNFSAYAPYINALLVGLKYTSPILPSGEIRGKLNTLFHMVRFGYVPDNADPGFVNFVFPIVKSSVRGGRTNVLDATVAIYEWLKAVHGDSADWKSGMGNNGVATVAVTDADLAALEAGELVMLTDTQDALEKLRGGKLPGIGEQQIVVKETDDEFYRNVCHEYAETISQLRLAFLQKYDKPAHVLSFEGELELSAGNQQRAYLDEILGEESRVYHVNKKRLLDIKVLTYRDISSSTSGFKLDFAKAIVIFHAALEGIHGVKTAHLDFSSGAAVVFGFDDNVAKAAIRPHANGNTHLMPAIELAAEMDLTARRVLHFVITDGQINDPLLCQEKLQELGQAWFIEIIPPGVDADGGYVKDFANHLACTLEELPFELLERLG